MRHVRKAVMAPCICRREIGLLGKGCGNPEETCLIFDGGAEYYLHNRQIEPGGSIDDAVKVKSRQAVGIKITPYMSVNKTDKDHNVLISITPDPAIGWDTRSSRYRCFGIRCGTTQNDV